MCELLLECLIVLMFECFDRASNFQFSIFNFQFDCVNVLMCEFLNVLSCYCVNVLVLGASEIVLTC